MQIYTIYNVIYTCSSLYYYEMMSETFLYRYSSRVIAFIKRTACCIPHLYVSLNKSVCLMNKLCSDLPTCQNLQSNELILYIEHQIIAVPSTLIVRFHQWNLRRNI